MAKTAKISWGIDIGNCSLKALKLGTTADGVEVLDYAVIKHEKILSQPDVDPQQRDGLIRKALTQFMSQHDVNNDPVVVAVPGHSSFARFIKLPPVESKRITEIVRFEAIQQIPFDINDVEWDWQTFTSENDPEVEVGIFAIKKDLVSGALDPFSQVRCPVHMVQMAPMALYNFLQFDQQKFRGSKGNEATILLDIGAENTDLVIADDRRVWQRSIPIGGNQFTAAVQKAFKLGFAKAEAIKRTASTSKYARQIFQAMRSVFADLAAEIQRSLGFYSGGNREVQFREVLALGSALRLPGLMKFLQQSLSLPIKRVGSFEALKLSSEVSVAQFTESLPSLALAYGLALQGLGQAAIVSNLLPTAVARKTQWQRKRRWFIAASTLILVGSLLFMFDAYSESARIQSPETQTSLRNIEAATRAINQGKQRKDAAETQVASAQKQIGDYKKYYEDTLSTINQRALVPILYRAIRDCVPNPDNTPDQKDLFGAYLAGNVDEVLKIPREQRKQVFVNQINLIYTDDLSKEFEEIIGDRLSTSGYSQRTSTYGSGGRVEEENMDYYGIEEEDGYGPSYRSEEELYFRRGDGRPGAPPMGRYAPPNYGSLKTPGIGQPSTVSEEGVPGFVVVIEGITPHHGDLSFLFPPDVGTERGRWGFFNRLRNLGKTDEQIIAEAKAQFEPKKTTGVSTLKTRGRKEPNQPPPVVVKPSSPSEATLSLTGSDVNTRAKELPFETYFDPEAETVESYFDISRRGWLVGATDGKSSQPSPGEVGVLREEEETAKIQPTARMLLGRPQAGILAGNRSLKNPVYLDSITQEPITDTYEREEDGTIKMDDNNQPIIHHHDYWFQIRFKVKLKEDSQA